MAKQLLGAFLFLWVVDGYGAYGTETAEKLEQTSRVSHLIVTSSAMTVVNSHPGSKEYNYRNENAESVRPVVISINDVTTCVRYNSQFQKCDGYWAEEHGVTRCNFDATHSTTSCNPFANTASSVYSLSASASFEKLDITYSASASRATSTQHSARIQSKPPTSTRSLIPSLTELPLQPIHTPYGFVIVQTLTLSYSKTGTRTHHRNLKVSYSSTHSASSSRSTAPSNRKIKGSEYHAMQIRREIVVGCLIGGIMALIAGGLGAVLFWGWAREKRRKRFLEMEEGKVVDD